MSTLKEINSYREIEVELLGFVQFAVVYFDAAIFCFNDTRTIFLLFPVSERPYKHCNLDILWGHNWTSKFTS